MGMRWSPIIQETTRFVDFGEAPHVQPQVPDSLEFIVFGSVLFWTRAQAHASPLTDNQHLFICFC